MIIVDLDNCISDDKWRVPLINWSIENKFHRYHPYHMASPGDALVNGHLLKTFDEIAIITSRPSQYRWLATMWLDYHKVKYNWLFMREDPDLTSPEVKRRALKHLRAKTARQVTMAYDDRQDVIDMYLQEGVPATRLAIHNYDQGEWYGPKECG